MLSIGNVNIRAHTTSIVSHVMLLMQMELNAILLASALVFSHHLNKSSIILMQKLMGQYPCFTPYISMTVHTKTAAMPSLNPLISLDKNGLQQI